MERSHINIPGYHDFLKSYGISRVELDNLLHDGEVNLSGAKIKASLYVPYAYVTTTRFCNIPSYNVSMRKLLPRILPCKKECQLYSFKLTHSTIPVPLLMKGNTQFVRNDRIPDALEQKGINRLVYQPEIPM